MSNKFSRPAFFWLIPLVTLNLAPAIAADKSAAADSDWVAHNPIHLRTDTIASKPRGYSPAQMRHAYGVDQVPLTGAGQTIALVDAIGSPTIQHDLDVFSSTYGIPSAKINIVYPQGNPRSPNTGWAQETSLDVEWAHAIAPGANIMLVVAKGAGMRELINAVGYAASNGATQISMSWGGFERPSESNHDSLFSKSGVMFIAASGDNGPIALWPASSPRVVGVGGTTLTLDTNGVIVTETAWQGSGGGQSRYEPRPTFQNGWQTSSQRGIPDVSYNADPMTGVSIYLSAGLQPGWITVGGTSAGSPQVAAILALANSGRSSLLGDPNTALYNIASARYALYFNDIKQGGNRGFSAGPGYDFVTGLGSPLCNLLIPALVVH